MEISDFIKINLLGLHEVRIPNSLRSGNLTRLYVTVLKNVLASQDKKNDGR